MASTCYRIVIEAVRNAIRHARAEQITIASAQENDRLKISITDNGSGFDPEAVPQDRFGLRSMRGRAKLIGGNLEIQSKPGGPTEVLLQIPVGES